MFDEATELPETLKSLVVSTDNKSFEDTTAASILGNRTCLNKHIVHKASLLFIFSLPVLHLHVFEKVFDDWYMVEEVNSFFICLHRLVKLKTFHRAP